jgi:hypothetical protein
MAFHWASRDVWTYFNTPVALLSAETALHQTTEFCRHSPTRKADIALSSPAAVSTAAPRVSNLHIDLQSFSFYSLKRSLVQLASWPVGVLRECALDVRATRVATH